MLSREGLSLVRGLSPDEFMDLMAGLGTIHPHPDAGPSGVTHVQPDGRHTELPGAGFSRSALDLHTDRSSLRTPPKFLGLYLARQGRTGGVPVFADLHLLSRAFPAAELATLSITSRDGTRLPVVLETAGRGFRFRDDSWWRLDGPAVLVAAVRQTLRDITFSAPMLASGDAYLLDNHRVAHGRTAIGDLERSALRVLVDEG